QGGEVIPAQGRVNQFDPATLEDHIQDGRHVAKIQLEGGSGPGRKRLPQGNLLHIHHSSILRLGLNQLIRAEPDHVLYPIPLVSRRKPANFLHMTSLISIWCEW